MKKHFFFLSAFVILSLSGKAQSPSVELFKKVFEAQMQKLIPYGYTRRTICFVQVTPGTPNGGYYPFKVTTYIHDYNAGYPKNNYYGSTCLKKMDGWKFDLRKDEFGEWIVQGYFTVLDGECRDNPSEGVESIPLSSVPAAPYKKTNANNTSVPPANEKPPPPGTSNLYIGEYACYGYGGRIMTGMGFVLLPGGRYYDLDKRRGGAYTYNPQTATIRFTGGFLSGQTGKNVKQTGFEISNTVRAEPWR